MNAMSPKVRSKYKMWLADSDKRGTYWFHDHSLFDNPADRNRFFEFVREYIESGDYKKHGNNHQQWLEYCLREEFGVEQPDLEDSNYQKDYLEQIGRTALIFEYIVGYELFIRTSMK